MKYLSLISRKTFDNVRFPGRRYSTKIVLLVAELGGNVCTNRTVHWAEFGRVKTIDNRGGKNTRFSFGRLLACFERLHATRTSDIVIYIIGRLPTLLGRCTVSLAGTLTPPPLVPGRIASRATLPLSRSRGWRLETTISSSRRRPSLS